MSRRGRLSRAPLTAEERERAARLRAAEERREAARAWLLARLDAPPPATDALMVAVWAAHREVAHMAKRVRDVALGLATEATRLADRVERYADRGDAPSRLRTLIDDGIGDLAAAIAHREALVDVLLSRDLVEDRDNRNTSEPKGEP